MAADSETVIQGRDRAAIVQALRRRIAQAEQAFDSPTRRGWVSTGLAALDARLAGGGLPAGGLVELVSGEDGGSDGGGTLTLATWLAGRACSGDRRRLDRAPADKQPVAPEVGWDQDTATDMAAPDGWHGQAQRRHVRGDDTRLKTPHDVVPLQAECPASPCRSPREHESVPTRTHAWAPDSNADYVVVIDRSGEFYPPAAVGLGVAMARMVLVQPGREVDGLWAAQEALRSPAVAAVLMTGLGRADHRQSRRLQLAAEAGGGIGLIVRPTRSTGRVSSAAVRLMVSPTACEPGRYRWCVQVMRCRGGPASPPVVIGLDDEARVVPVDAASVDRAGEPTPHRVSG